LCISFVWAGFTVKTGRYSLKDSSGDMPIIFIGEEIFVLDESNLIDY
jgi:hypothetical protein